MPYAIRAADVRDAARTIAGHVLLTPTMPAPRLSDITGAAVVVKHENMQATGAFKERGAANRLAALGPAEREAGSSPCRPATTPRRSPTMPAGSGSRRPSSCP